MKHIGNAQKITTLAKELFREERATMRLDGWFYIKEIRRDSDAALSHLPPVEKAGEQLKIIAEKLPISISQYAVFAGTQRDAFARSYALINPSFRVEGFSGYCDPTAVYGDIEPNEEISAERIAAMQEYDKQTDFVTSLADVYKKYEEYTDEVEFFVEQVTGHVIPDMRPALKHGVEYLMQTLRDKANEGSEKQQSHRRGMLASLEAVLILARRYRALARKLAADAEHEEDKARYGRIADALERVPAKGATNLFEAIQSFMLLWQTMCIEQAPNPFAFSVGNADRIFEPYRAMEALGRDDTAALLKHLLVFYNVGDRSWAISQNLIIGGRDVDGNDLTNPTSLALFDAYFDMNLPQPILSVKLHKNTPDVIYEEMGRFFFTPGCLTPSLFNDDAMFEVLIRAGVAREDLPDYSIAGCQEPLIMGRDSGNTTNSWLNLGKVLELTLTGGISAISGKEIGKTEEIPAKELLQTIREQFYARLEKTVANMTDVANGASVALSNLPVPMLSTLMGGIESGYDMRDATDCGTKYHGSGCLIHGSAVVADSFIAIDHYLKDHPDGAQRLLAALKNNFEGEEELRQTLLSYPKFGNNDDEADTECASLCARVADMVRAGKNYLGYPFRPDFSTPSTHLLYGYWVGALPDGRRAREMLNYGIDPLHGDANLGLGFRTLSSMKLPHDKMCGGEACHLGIDPKYFRGETFAERGMEFKRKVMTPLFFNPMATDIPPFYVYLNITTPEILRKVLANPKKYAPGGVYIMRIHGTFVNFLDLSPAIQQDIITRLDPASTAC
ncbi:MAG: hypothetical protein IJW40_03520 [Clostridia bacterium]|nr:hypothetical protein [Clostridia bacterium]